MKSHGHFLSVVEYNHLSYLSLPGRNYSDVLILCLRIYFLLVENAEFSACLIHLFADEGFMSCHPLEQDLQNIRKLSPTLRVPGVSLQFREKVTDITATHEQWLHLTVAFTLMIADTEEGEEKGLREIPGAEKGS